MNLKLTCPVCDRPQIDGNICPNCETDLSLVRMLRELPKVSRKFPIGLLIMIASLSFGVGVSVMAMAMKFLFSG